MKRARTWLLTAAVLALAASAAFGCGGPKETRELTFECGTTAVWSELLEETVDPAGLVVRRPDGQAEDGLSASYRFAQKGVYEVEYGGVLYRVTVADTTPPVIRFVGDFENVKKGDTVDLSKITVADLADGELTDFTLTVTCGTRTVPVENKRFVASSVGVYTITVTAVDAGGNQGTDHRQFTVERQALATVPVGTAVDAAALDYASDLGEGYAYEYAVTSAGAPVALDNHTFVVEANRYYEIHTTATKGTEVHKFYACYAAEGMRFTSFDEGIPGSVGAYRFDRAEVVTDEWGNRSAKFSDNSQNGVGQILFQMEDTLRYRVSFDLTVTGTFTDSWILSLGKNSAEEGETVLGIGDVGKKIRYTCTVTPRDADKLICIILTPHSDFFEHRENALTVDNVVLTPLAAPTLAGESERQAEAGDELTFTAQALGVTAADCYGGALACNLLGVSYFDGLATVPVEEESVHAANGVYTVVFEALDAWGNSARYEVKIFVGGTDFRAPELHIATTDRAVAPGTVVALDETSLGLTVSDDSGYDLSFAVTKNGAAAAAEAFTVGESDYFEVVVTATDRSPNAYRTEGYLIVRSSALLMETFEEGGNPDLGVIAYQFGQSEEVTLENGSTAKRFFGNTVAEQGQIDAQMTDDAKYRLTFDITVTGTFTDNWVLSLGKDCAEEGERVITVEEVGQKLRLSFTVAGRADFVYALLLHPHPDFFADKENGFILDNLVFTRVEATPEQPAPELSVAQAERTVAAGTTVALDERSLGLTVSGSADYEIAYEVCKNGAPIASEAFVVGAGDYYEIRITVTNRSPDGLQDKGYVLVRSESLTMFSFTDGIPGDVGAYRFDRAEAVTDEWGNASAKFSHNSQNGAGQILFQMTDTARYTVSFDIAVSGTFVDSWALAVGGAGTTEEEAVMITAAQAGQRIRLTFTVTPRADDKLICINLTPHSDFFDHPDNAFLLDNVVLTRLG